MEVGLPHHIKLLHVPSSRMWAGNQPFPEQPIVGLLDAGGNIVENELGGTMNAVLVTSLSQNSDIIIDTSNDNVPTIDSVQFHQSHIKEQQVAYSSGHNISIIVTFTQEVTVKILEDVNFTSPLLPSLELNVLDENGLRSKAYLVINNIQPSRRLCFRYTVSKGPTMDEVNIFSRNSFETNDYLVMDAWQRSVAVHLPSLNSTKNLLASKNITVHSKAATITNISTSIDSGEYGAGHIIDFKVKFNHTVSFNTQLMSHTVNYLLYMFPCT